MPLINDNDKFHFYTNQSSFVFIPVRREEQPDQDANKNETEKVADIAPGLGGTNVRFPSKFLNIWSKGFFIGDNYFQNGRETVAKKDAFFTLLRGENLWIIKDSHLFHCSKLSKQV